MKEKSIGIFVCILLIFAAVLPVTGMNSTETKTIDYSIFLGDDVIIPPDIEERGSNRGPEPGYYDMSEFMMGTIALGIIFLESDGTIDPSTEDWTQQEKDTALGAFGIGGGHILWGLECSGR